MTENRVIKVAFADASVQRAFIELKEGRFEDRELAEWIQKSLEELRMDPFSGISIPRKLWPKYYVDKYGVDNLRKLDLPQGWRLIYFVRGNEVEIVSILLEWFDHADYNKRFGYKKN